MINAKNSQSRFIFVIKRTLKNKISTFCLLILSVYLIAAILAKVGLLSSDWGVEVGDSYESPSLNHIFGTDLFGRSVLKKIIKSAEVAMSVGFVVSVISIVVGVFLGVLAGYFGGIVDGMVVWLYTILSSVPSTMLLISIAFIMGKGILAVYVALSVNYWIDICQSVRSEVMRHRERDYVLAASAIGATHFRKIWYHILPNIMHLILIKFAIVFQQAIKAEVMLSYLGLGVQNQPSWGRMIDEAKIELVRGVWWQLFFATFFMFLVVLAFNLVSDALRDALDPKLNDK